MVASKGLMKIFRLVPPSFEGENSKNSSYFERNYLESVLNYNAFILNGYLCFKILPQFSCSIHPPDKGLLEPDALYSGNYSIIATFEKIYTRCSLKLILPTVNNR